MCVFRVPAPVIRAKVMPTPEPSQVGVVVTADHTFPGHRHPRQAPVATLTPPTVALLQPKPPRRGLWQGDFTIRGGRLQGEEKKKKSPLLTYLVCYRLACSLQGR